MKKQQKQGINFEQYSSQQAQQLAKPTSKGLASTLQQQPSQTRTGSSSLKQASQKSNATEVVTTGNNVNIVPGKMKKTASTTAAQSKKSKQQHDETEEIDAIEGALQEEENDDEFSRD